MALTMKPFGLGLALKTTRHSMIPMILQENNAKAHQSGLRRRQGGEGTMVAPMLLFRRECLPKGMSLFSVWKARGQLHQGRG